jgi:hypothetical protein
MADPNETLVPFVFGDVTIPVSSFDALMLSSDLLLTGNAFVVPDGARYRRIRPGDVTPGGESVQRIEVEKWPTQS